MKRASSPDSPIANKRLVKAAVKRSMFEASPSRSQEFSFNGLRKICQASRPVKNASSKPRDHTTGRYKYSSQVGKVDR